MIDFGARIIAKWLLSLRYDISISGIEAIAAKGRSGILFLPNHPALIDPVIIYAYLHRGFAPRGFADKDQVDRFLIRWFARRWGVRTIPSIARYGPSAREKVEKVLDESIEGLKNGENLLLWPAGHIYHSYKEKLSGTSGVERILQKCPEVRVVLVRTKGLWGSSFGWASGNEPKVAKVLLSGSVSLLSSGIFFAPKRRVTIEFSEPSDLPRDADRNVLNSYLEAFYNTDAPKNTYIPYTVWEKGGTVTLPEPVMEKFSGDLSGVSETVRETILDYLSEATGVYGLKDRDRLGQDLGMDSLARMDLIVWLEKEFGFGQADADAMQTVGDVMLAACGEFAHAGPVKLKPISPRWFREEAKERLSLPEGETVTEVFLKQAARGPSRIAIADQRSGVKSYRDIVVGCMVLKGAIEKLSGDYVGIMMPASVGADILYFAALFAGKVPVMVNWTAGLRNIIGPLDSVGVKHILTAKTVVDRITSHGVDFSEIENRFVFVEQMAEGISRFSKLRAWLAGQLSWRSLYKAKISNLAAVLFTSGSETLPKAVPLTHKNLLANVRDIFSVTSLYENDKLIGFLPPFHSFGLTGTILAPLCGGARVVYHPNPTESAVLAQLIEVYGVSVLMGTPTFLNGIVRVAQKEQLSSLHLAVTGAERCSERLYKELKGICEKAVILEGYGVTECSPIISISDEKQPKPFTIGKVLPSLKYMLIEPETASTVTIPGKGVLLVRGESVFEGYLNYEGKSPFVRIDGKKWYNTGDIVSVDENSVLTFSGRLKRFVKLGGEMISLPAIEAVLQQHYVSDADEGPVIAVEATSDEQNPELVLFAVRDLDRETVNGQIREAGLSGLHNIRRVIKLKEIPTLGTGKTDYRALKKKI